MLLYANSTAIGMVLASFRLTKPRITLVSVASDIRCRGCSVPRVDFRRQRSKYSIIDYAASDGRFNANVKMDDRGTSRHWRRSHSDLRYQNDHSCCSSMFGYHEFTHCRMVSTSTDTAVLRDIDKEADRVGMK